MVLRCGNLLASRGKVQLATSCANNHLRHDLIYMEGSCDLGRAVSRPSPVERSAGPLHFEISHILSPVWSNAEF